MSPMVGFVSVGTLVSQTGSICVPIDQLPAAYNLTPKYIGEPKITQINQKLVVY
nr:hypothetical protein [uncultured archaeon]